MSNKNSIYLDYNATSPVLPEVMEAMLPYFSTQFGNSASAAHSHGWDADHAVESARAKVAEFIGATPQEITFTSGATESNNWCLRGLVDLWRNVKPQTLGEGPMSADGLTPLVPIHILSTPLEHGSVSAVLNYLKLYHSVEVDLLPIDRHGIVQSSAIASLLKPHTKLISASWVQNEIGSVQPMTEIVSAARERGILVLSDATQALGKIPLEVQRAAVDYLSFSAHKIGGPKGVGFLYVKKSSPKPVPLFFGGGHEKGLRSATVNVPGVVGLGRCAEWWMLNGAQERERLFELQKYFWSELSKAFPATGESGLQLNGSPLGSDRSPMNLNVTFRGYSVPATVPGISMSKGSACSSGKVTVSASLKALGLSELEMERTIRFSIGEGTSREDIDSAVSILAQSLRKIS